MAPPRAVAYIRTSSLSNVGVDKDSETRQVEAIKRHAAASNLVIARRFSDPGVSGTDAVHTRPGFQDLLDYAKGAGISTIVFEDRAGGRQVGIIFRLCL